MILEISIVILAIIVMRQNKDISRIRKEIRMLEFLIAIRATLEGRR